MTARSASITSDVIVERITGAVGALVRDVDVHGRITEGQAEALRRTLHEHGVLVFEPEAPIAAEAFVRLSRCFGDPVVYPYRLDTSESELNVLSSDVAPADAYRSNRWHTDGSAQERPPSAALLTPKVLPDVGGDTMWASMYAAWDALSSRYQRLLDGLEAVHSAAALLRKYPSDLDVSMFSPGDRAVHPVVASDPVTGRKLLYVNENWTERILGLSDAESERTLAALYEHIDTPEFHMRLRWRPNTIVIWEERVTQHRAVADYAGVRQMFRIALAGDRPSA